MPAETIEPPQRPEEIQIDAAGMPHQEIVNGQAERETHPSGRAQATMAMEAGHHVDADIAGEQGAEDERDQTSAATAGR